ncbi:hypothetical protein B9N66_06955 [Campylobacter concisus]|uniref:MFS transporter n=1 Tax=Campylobacter concisus TaxID=199 RepID=UPI000B3D7434|nr:MFS transporter [Campylobacter concisus]OUT08671.1 hypothetical protein B9N66_06955 [Campylobacter concisus]
MGIVVVSLVSLAMTAIQVPSQKATTAPGVKEQLKLAANDKILLVLLVTILGYGGTFATFMYLSPILQEITGISSKYVSIVLVGYGVMIAVGNSLGGKFGDKNPAKSVFWIFTAQSAVLLGFYFTQSNLVLGPISVALMGLAAFISVPVLQSLILILAKKYAPNAGDIASSFNAGIALGALFGGYALDKFSLGATSLAAFLISGAAAILSAVALLGRKDS